jgi:phosphatidylserine/phosphatidylglycerophosphate/cardiolipin synthase-like enzyme
MHCHHEKLIVVDDSLGFVGGIDLTDLAGDRYDTSGHPPRGGLGWHDAACRIEGPAVGDVVDHFRMRWLETTGQRLPPPSPQAEAGQTELQVVRTVPDGMYGALPAGDFRILMAYLGALRSASKLIYIENQFLWSPEIVAVLRDKLRRPPSPEFRMVLVLPARPYNGGDDTRGHLSTLIQADDGAGRLLGCTLYAHGGRNIQSIYVHAKVAIVDDRWLTVGSANLNEHSLFNDTEVNLVTNDRSLAASTRLRLWAEHLEVPLERVSGEPALVIDQLWKPVAEEQARRRAAGQELTQRLCLLPGASRRSELLMGPLQGLIVDA